MALRLQLFSAQDSLRTLQRLAHSLSTLPDALYADPFCLTKEQVGDKSGCDEVIRIQEAPSCSFTHALSSNKLPMSSLKAKSIVHLPSLNESSSMCRIGSTSCSTPNFSFRSFHLASTSGTRSGPRIHSFPSSGVCCPTPLSLQDKHRVEVSGRRTYATKKGGKIKIKSYSSYKQRFWSTPDGGFKRMKAGKRHNNSSKTKKQLRGLRTPTVTPRALARVMRKLGFQGR